MRLIFSFAYGEFLTIAGKLVDDPATEGHQVFPDSDGLRKSPEWVHLMEMSSTGQVTKEMGVPSPL
jgi:hypothetical protein